MTKISFCACEAARYAKIKTIHEKSVVSKRLLALRQECCNKEHNSACIVASTYYMEDTHNRCGASLIPQKFILLQASTI